MFARSGNIEIIRLNYAWEKLSKKGDIPFKNVHIVEIDGAEHRNAELPNSNIPSLQKS